jgi:hypothetical protein
MPRAPDSKRLSDEEARDFRVVVRRLRELRELTNEALAEELDWDVRRLTNKLSESQPVLAPAALEILNVVVYGPKDPPPRGFATKSAAAEHWNITQAYAQRASWRWDGRATDLAPAVLIRPSEAEHLARRLVNAIANDDELRLRRSSAKRDALCQALTGALRRDAPKMAERWAWESAQTAFEYVAAVGRGEENWEFAGGSNALDLVGARPELRSPPSFAQAVVYKIAALSVPDGSARREQGRGTHAQPQRKARLK